MGGGSEAGKRERGKEEGGASLSLSLSGQLDGRRVNASCVRQLVRQECVRQRLTGVQGYIQQHLISYRHFTPSPFTLYMHALESE